MLLGLRVQFSGRQPGHEVVLGRRQERLFHQVEDLHRRHNIGDRAVDLQRRRLMTRRLADHHPLDEVTHDRHQALLGVFVGIIACKEEELADRNLHACGIELRLQLLNLLLKILCRLCQTHQLQRHLLAHSLEFIELVVEDSKARPTFRQAIFGLLHQVLLLLANGRQFRRQFILACWRIL
ncbi:hypothetical protein [Pseudorhizobium flavum]|uniref:hypothetical protein n=1 Tax=Pseudorhizobium flavum TaxID=1335061 RepID=UPI00377035B1